MAEIRDAIRQGPQACQAMYQEMYQTNPDFRAFADSMSGMTPQQAFSQMRNTHGPSFDQFMQQMGMR